MRCCRFDDLRVQLGQCPGGATGSAPAKLATPPSATATVSTFLVSVVQPTVAGAAETAKKVGKPQISTLVADDQSKNDILNAEIPLTGVTLA